MVSLGFGALECPDKEGAFFWHAREKCPILAQRFLEHRKVCRPAQYLQVSAFHFYFGMSLCLWSLLVLGEFRATCSVVKNKTIPFVILSLRPIFCCFDTSLSSLIADINWCSHLLQYSRLLLCCLTRTFQAVTYSLRKNSFDSHEVYLQVFVVTSLTLVIVESRARGFRVLHYQRWRNGKLPKLCLLPATLA